MSENYTESAGPPIFAIAMYLLLLISYSINAADRQLFPLLAYDVRREYGFSLAETGLLSTIFTFGLATAGMPAAYLLSRFSRKAVLLLGISIFSAGTALITVATGFPDMLVYLAATGIGEAMQLTVMIAIAASYFVRYRAAAIGSMNVFFGIGAFTGPILTGFLLSNYRNWRIPLIAFAAFGLVMVAIVSAAIRPWFSETRRGAQLGACEGGAASLNNRNTILLTAISIIAGLALFGFTGMYSTFLREVLHYSPKQTGFVASFYGVGALFSIFCGWIGDRLSPRILLSATFFLLALVGYAAFGSETLATRAALTALYGIIGSGTIYVNLAGYHVKAVRKELASRASGTFVTSLYSASAAAGYSMGGLANYFGWTTAAAVQVSLLSIIGGCLALLLRPEDMSL